MPQPATPIAYTHAQVSAWVGTSMLAKALPLVASVFDIVWLGSTLSGSLYGSRGDIYDVDIDFDRYGGQTEAMGTCNCSKGYDCVHVAAVLLANLAHQPSKAGGVRSELLGWLEGFRVRSGSAAVNAAKTKKAKSPYALIYALSWATYSRQHEVQFFKAGLARDGSVRAIAEPWNNVEKCLLKPPQYVGDEDLAILRLLWMGHARNNFGAYKLSGANGSAVLDKMLASGRLFALESIHSVGTLPLRAGDERPALIQWTPSADDRLQAVLQTRPPCTGVVVVEPPWYVDRASGTVGPAQVPWDITRIADYLTMPPITLAEAPLVGALLRDIAPDLPAPPNADEMAIRVVDCEPVPVLHLNSLPTYESHYLRYGQEPELLDHASVSFEYEGLQIGAQESTTLVKGLDGGMVQIRRQVQTEKRRLEQLRNSGMDTLSTAKASGPITFPASTWGFRTAKAWPHFMQQTLPELVGSGWRTQMNEGFRFNVIEIESIDGQVRQASDGWFDVEMGIVLGDRTVRLETLLADLFARDGRWLGGNLDDIADEEAIDLKIESGERLRFRARRLKPVVRVLIDLLEGLGGLGGGIRVSRLDAGRLEALNDTGRWQFHGDDSIRLLAQRLKGGPGVREVALPLALSATLRSYQHQGLNWMQFLREHNLCGVLADDMGLGKTVQTLAHVLVEKEALRLDRPALIVVPTSLVHNWCEEARRFTPSLRVLSLHGDTRKERFEQIGQHDLVITTYALLWRDQALLSKHSYHLLILDEAQFVKNANTKGAVAIRELQARHRLCLTGTPLENHLGELWSLFDFLLPGFLGSQKDFTKRWRTPIEKGGDSVRRDLLARRIRPFMLRRRKDEVAKELPAKTTIVRSVDLEGDQRDLYEIVRTAMQEKVRAVIAAQGLERSHIVVLDALLKLRQVCCDPRLVKLERASSVKESAKLDLLMSMLTSLIEEGRRVLLFSQFTGMLNLIAEAVQGAGINYVVLTGDTLDRATPVRRFQNGEVPLFLISLKAGGVGLNLTAADTVIHYDPWWNPAAENQATDRAHRLGQDKPVFVYKLIVAGSIEEKIVSLQEKKAALAQGILSEDGAAAVKFSPADLDALFAPIEAVGRLG
jgi:SNF2 family DNA or RNA helicase